MSPSPCSPTARGAWIGRSVVLDTDWGLDTVTGRLRLWNPVQGRWYLTVRESGTAHEQEAARARKAEAAREKEAVRANQEAVRARKAEAEIARLQALLQRQGHAPRDSLD